MSIQPPASGAYFQLLSAFTTPDEQAALWNGFLQANGLTANPTDQTQLPNFVSYIESNYANSLSSIQLSPDEMKKRQIMFSVFDILAFLMQKMQQTVGTQAELLQYYAAAQQQYSNMAMRVPIYLGAAGSGPLYSPDFTKFSVGYDAITLDDILQQAAILPSTSLFSMARTNLPNGNKSQLVFLPPGHINPGPQIILNYTDDSNHIISGITVPVPVNPGDSTATIIQKYSTALQTIVQQALTPGFFQVPVGTSPANIISTYFPNISWKDNQVHHQGESAQEGAFADQAAANRAASNAKNQQYLEAIRSTRETIANTSDGTRSNLESSNTSLKQQNDVMNSILQNMRAMLGSIFK